MPGLSLSDAIENLGTNIRNSAIGKITDAESEDIMRTVTKTSICIAVTGTVKGPRRLGRRALRTGLTAP